MLNKGRRSRAAKLFIPKRRTQTTPLTKPQMTLTKHKSTPTINVAPLVDPELADMEIKYSSHKNSCPTDIRILLTPPFSEVPPKDWRKIFKNKCLECSKICDFSNPTKDVAAKTAKTTLLHHIKSSFSIPHIMKGISSDTVQIFYQMCSINIFRDFPSVNIINLHDGSLPNIQDAAWGHLSIIYEAMLSILNIGAASEFPPNFLTRLIDNIQSNDCRERHFVATILTAISNRFPIHRPILKKKTIDMLSSRHGSSALVDWAITLSFGMQIPLKPETNNLFLNTILPLHCLPEMPQFGKPLTKIVNMFISKNEELFEPTIYYILKHWPVHDITKQTALIDEMEVIVIGFYSKSHNKLMFDFFKHIENCITDENSALAERAIKLVTNREFATVIKDHTNGIIFAIYSALSDTISQHWDKEIVRQATSALRLIESYDPQSCKKALDAQKLLKSRKRAQKGICKKNWQNVFENVKKMDPTIPTLIIPTTL